MTRNWKAILGVVLVFCFGCFIGAMTTSIIAHHVLIDFLQHPGVKLSAALEKRLTGNLDLDADQKKQVDGFFNQNLDERKNLQKQIQPQVRELNRSTIQQVAAILKPDQKERFHQNVERMRKRLGAAGLKEEADNVPSLDGQPGAPATNSGATNSPNSE